MVSLSLLLVVSLSVSVVETVTALVTVVAVPGAIAVMVRVGAVPSPVHTQLDGLLPHGTCLSGCGRNKEANQREAAGPSTNPSRLGETASGGQPKAYPT